MRLATLAIALPLLASCATAPSVADRDACLAAGHRVDTAGFEACLQELQRQRFDRQPGATIDEIRRRNL